MMLFEIPAKDQSQYYLGQIFGLVGNLLPVKSAPLLMSLMFKFLNSMALTIGAFIVVYVTVVGLIATAHEGEFMGKKWSGLWVPLRTVFGIAALFPTTTGYCAIQIVFMWVILQGVGAADVLWKTVIEYVAKTGSPTAGVSVDDINPIKTQASLRTLFQALSCQAQARINGPNIKTRKNINFYCASNEGTPSADSFCPGKRSDGEMLNILTGPQSNRVNKYSMGPGASGGEGGQCGTLTYCTLTGLKADSKEAFACRAQQTALQSIVNTFGAIAQQLAVVDYNYVYFYEVGYPKGQTPDWALNYCSANTIDPEQCCQVPPPPSQQEIASGKLPTCAGSFPSDMQLPVTPPYNASADAVNGIYVKFALQSTLQGSDFINGALGTYVAAIVGAVSDWLKNQPASLSPWQKEAIENGWILAGSYYFKMADSDKSVIAALAPTLQMSAPPQDPITGFRNNYDVVGNMLAQIASSSQPTADFAGNSPQFSGVSTTLGTTSGTLLRTMISNLSGHGGSDVGVTKPLASISNYGYSLMITAQLLFVVLTATAMAIAGVASIDPIVLGTGLTMNPFGEAVKAGIGLIGPFLTLLVSSLFLLGATLAIYIPLIPVIVFTVGAIGWLIATIEAMVAAPLVALGILSPGGQHEILGRAEPALMLLFNLFLRPTLMVLGMMAAILVSVAVVSLINVAFLNAVSTVMTAPGLFEQIMFIAAYTSLLVTALNKTFSLIYVVPERVLTWIGGPAVQYGEGEALGAMKHGIEGAGGATMGASGQAYSGGQSGAAAVGKAEGVKRSEDKKGADAIKAQEAKSKEGGGGTPPAAPPKA